VFFFVVISFRRLVVIITRLYTKIIFFLKNFDGTTTFT
jgi:hypothetical protein